jgi:DNA-binding transcriptional MerR regulator
MALKQTSFNFDFDESEPSPKSQPLQESPKPSKADKHIKKEPVVELVEEPIDLDWAPAVKPKKSRPAKASRRGRMKISDMAATAEWVDVPEDEILFAKSYYTIGAVTNMFKVNHSLIRFWENEFDILKPKKNGKGDRLFRPEDIKNLKLIHHLLRERKYTIEGAKDYLKKSKLADQRFALIDSLKDLKTFLLEIKAGL